MIRIYFGKQCAGKSYYENKCKGFMKPIISYTTRPMREGEQDGRDYNFITEEKFKSLVDAGKIMEHREYVVNTDGTPRTWFYGSPQIEDYRENDYVCVLDIDGILTYLDKYDKQFIELVYVNADPTTRLERAQTRGSFKESEWHRREQSELVDFGWERIKKVLKAYDSPINALSNNYYKVTFWCIEDEKTFKEHELPEEV